MTDAPIEPCSPAPTPAQLRWQEMEYSGFVHFNMSTFCGAGGHVDAGQDPDAFCPDELDCGQWARAAVDAGMRMLVLTAKHHDGFCLWPSEQTDYSVASSRWRGGRGDVVADCADACREHGLAFGIYMSPWDKQHDSAAPGYAGFYDAQLRELLDGRYGEIAIVWLDGYGAQDIGEPAYQRWIATARGMQPDAVFRRGWGPDGRWGGDEAARVGYPQWCMMDAERAWRLRQTDNRAMQAYVRHGDPAGDVWMPAEADPPSYAGSKWFWHPGAECPDEGPLEGFEATVWRNAILSRGLAPDRRGLLPEDVVDYLRRCRENRDAFEACGVELKAATATSVRNNTQYAPDKALAAGDETFWAAANGEAGATWTAELAEPTDVAHVMLREPIALGQRVRKFTVELRTADGDWRPAFDGESIGRKQLCTVEPARATAVRVRLQESAACGLLAEVRVFRDADATRFPARTSHEH